MVHEIIRAEHIQKMFDRNQVLMDAWLHVLEGQTVGIVGLDNSGKTTFMRILAGQLGFDGGDIYLEGVKIPSARRDILSGKVAYLGSENSLVDELSIADNLCVLKNHPIRDFIVRKKKIRENSEKILKRVHVDARPGSPCSILEDNEKQRLEIAKVLAGGARLVILDCTGHTYNDQDIRELKELICSSYEKGVAFIFIHSNLEYVMQLSDEILVLKDGRSVRRLPKNKFDKQLIYKWMVGYEIKENSLYDRKKLPDAKEILRLAEVTSDRLKQISLEVKEGEIVGILSLSSRWNQEFIDILMGEAQIESGGIYRNGQAVNRQFLRDRGTVRNRTCFMHKANIKEELFENLPVSQNYVFLAQQKAAKTPLGILSRKIEMHLENEKAEDLGFSPDILKKNVEQLTNKELFELYIGEIKLFHPELLVLMNPTENSDVLLKEQIIGEIVRMAEDGIGILMISANFKEMSAICDRIIIVRKGTVNGIVDRRDFSTVNMNLYLE
ncbi:ATP-binding cassette domain-containing protein [Lachnospiraceae bacterium ASD3451]|uniref:ATP-binding cassette domain-containing protein n=1 Tax=Diplocloster agilis TaxID=2850323 RepID=UPI001E03B87C|nr:ATP-binding cassette domain-containing protein [Diplocloster agilis]MBU9747177.1 ATP-binding cassette domain-containing protein [Diplocloster agilis]